MAKTGFLTTWLVCFNEKKITYSNNRFPIYEIIVKFRIRQSFVSVAVGFNLNHEKTVNGNTRLIL